MVSKGSYLEPLQAPPYGAVLAKNIRKTEPERMLDSFLIAGLIEARSHERMSLLARYSPDEEIRDLYEGIFNTLTTSEFLYFWNMGTIKSVKNNYLIHSGEHQNNLLLVLSGSAHVEVNGNIIANLDRGAFIAEISFLSGEPASADVRANEELIFISWRSERLKNMQHDNPEFWMKLQHALSEDLIKKVKPDAKRQSQISE